MFFLVVLFLGISEGPGETEEESLEETGEEGSEIEAEEEDYEEEESEEEEEDYEEEEEDYEEDEGEEDYEEEEEDSEEDEEEGGISGFFKNLFGGGEESIDEEVIDDEEGYEEDYEGEEEYAEEVPEETKEYMEKVAREESVAEVPEPAPPVKQKVSVKKIKRVPYQVGSALVNAVYIARSGDTVESVSRKIYGSDQSARLYTFNPHFQSRPLKVGDKIYYTSPHRPTDTNQLLIYYEDLGVAPSNYLIAAGKNVREVAAQLLGHPESWKEIWATNPDLQSKGRVSGNVIVVYWPKGDYSKVTVRGDSVPEEEEASPEPAPAEELSSPPETTKPAPLPVLEVQKKGFIEENRGFLGLFLAFVAVIVLLARMIIMKRRKKKEFDYTSPNIKI